MLPKLGTGYETGGHGVEMNVEKKPADIIVVLNLNSLCGSLKYCSVSMFKAIEFLNISIKGGLNEFGNRPPLALLKKKVIMIRHKTIRHDADIIFLFISLEQGKAMGIMTF
jgi:hypothetical protein